MNVPDGGDAVAAATVSAATTARTEAEAAAEVAAAERLRRASSRGRGGTWGYRPLAAALTATCAGICAEQPMGLTPDAVVIVTARPAGQVIS